MLVPGIRSWEDQISISVTFTLNAVERRSVAANLALTTKPLRCINFPTTLCNLGLDSGKSLG